MPGDLPTERHAGALLVTALGTMALVLAVAGVYSVIAQVVVQRRRELAIRVTAGYLSARRAADVDSMTALKAE